MSWLPAPEPEAHAAGGAEPVEIVIEPVSKDLGGFSVRRVLPHAKRRTVGPFIFLDHMGPAVLPAGRGIDVRPHPHIGLSTLTYLTEGSLFHRDTLGTALNITPGAVNLMTAGRGIAHSERSDIGARAIEERAQGIQSWLALPQDREEMAPAFVHAAVDELPAAEAEGVAVRLILGALFGQRSAVPVPSETVYADVRLAAGRALPFPADHAERAVYVMEGAVTVDGVSYGAHRLLSLRPGAAVTVRAAAEGGPAEGQRGARVLFLGGEPLDGPRHLWWNFVSSRPERIEAAKADWREGRFGTVPGDTAEFIPLPE